MHEAALVAALLREVDETVARNGGGRATSIRVEIGPLAGVEPVLFAEAFRRLQSTTTAAGAELVIDAVALTCRCRSCGFDFSTDELRFECPECSGSIVDVLGGDGVVLHSVRIELPEAAETA